ncbi:hypothetical protein F7725_006295 [Dissostichus mawsoni]|uniref:Uncharacterized protein n=1 Tax=Dissostichus mawsoni TaxID=36200 RepID=A0A7J5YU13_DISMA|nr:hypothetical protein F7725_006295 [Dissostichus mawsoni]
MGVGAAMAFRRLFQFITGANVGMEMTAPVLVKIPEDTRIDAGDGCVCAGYGGWMLSVTSRLHAHLLTKELGRSLEAVEQAQRGVVRVRGGCSLLGSSAADPPSHPRADPFPLPHRPRLSPLTHTFSDSPSSHTHSPTPPSSPPPPTCPQSPTPPTPLPSPNLKPVLRPAAPPPSSCRILPPTPQGTFPTPQGTAPPCCPTPPQVTAPTPRKQHHPREQHHPAARRPPGNSTNPPGNITTPPGNNSTTPQGTAPPPQGTAPPSSLPHLWGAIS